MNNDTVEVVSYVIDDQPVQPTTSQETTVIGEEFDAAASPGQYQPSRKDKTFAPIDQYFERLRPVLSFLRSSRDDVKKLLEVSTTCPITFHLARNLFTMRKDIAWLEAKQDKVCNYILFEF